MKLSTKIVGSSTGLLAAAAFAGLISGAASHASAKTLPTSISQSSAKTSVVGKLGTQARHMDDAVSDKHDCKGKNDCKGKGGCKGDDSNCKGKNDCKGKGGCKTNGSL